MRYFQHLLCKLCLLLLSLGMAACGATIQLIDVDVKLPAEYPVHFDNREIAVFNALYDTTEPEGIVWNDSLIINKVAEGFRDQLALSISLEADSIPVFNHFCGQTSRGGLDDKEYIYSLAEQTGARTLVLIDSLSFGDFQHIRSGAMDSEYKPSYVNAIWQMVLRIYDMDNDCFVARLNIKDTLFWNILSKDQAIPFVNRKLEESLPQVAFHIGAALAKNTQPQWETQERVLFFFPGVKWYKALEHAFLFEWEEARDIWLALTRENKNPKKIACAAYNLAVASEMMGRIDLAKEWLNLSLSYMNIPEVGHYKFILDERKQHRATLLHIVDDDSMEP